MLRETQSSPRSLPSEQWIEEARNGSRSALDRLFLLCSSYLLAVANREFSAALRSRLDPGDVVQDTLMKAWRHFPQFRGQTEHDLLAWLRQILRRNMANERRRHLRTVMRCIRREVSLAAAVLLPLPDSIDRESELPGTQAYSREQHDALHDALRRLPERYRQVLQLHTQEELTFAQIGGRLHCSAEAARKLWSRAADRLAQLLESPGNLDLPSSKRI
jgi:RNA polymerase sigma-70 factor (ECF subfamily)